MISKLPIKFTDTYVLSYHHSKNFSDIKDWSFLLKIGEKNETEILFLYDYITRSDVCFAEVLSLG